MYHHQNLKDVEMLYQNRQFYWVIILSTEETTANVKTTDASQALTVAHIN